MEHETVHPPMSYKALAAVLVTLLLLTVVTVAVSYVDLGFFNVPVALGVACLKVTLVLLFFMHLKYDKIFHTVIFVSAILAAALFVGFTMMDTGQYQQSNMWDMDNLPRAPIGPRPITQ